MIKLANIKSVNRGRISDDRNKFVASNILSIIASIPTYSISNHMKHINVPRNTKYRWFKRGNVERKQLIDFIVDINWSSENKRIKKYSKVNYELIIQIRDWMGKHHSVIHLPIIQDTLLIKDECIGK